MATGRYSSPIHQEYNAMLASKRYQETSWDPEIAARMRQGNNASLYGYAGPAPPLYPTMPAPVPQQGTYLSELNQKKSKQQSNATQENDVPFWLRGNPQPMTGVRGSKKYNESFNGGTSIKTLAAEQQQLGAPMTMPMSTSNNYSPYGNNMGMLDSPYQALANSYSSPNAPLMRSYGSTPNISTMQYGAPAVPPPMQHMSMSTSQSFSNSGPKSEKDSYRDSLQRQIEEKKMQKALEKQKEWEEDEKQRKIFEQMRQRQQAELDAENQKQRQKQVDAQKKQEEIALANQAKMNQQRQPVEEFVHTVVAPKKKANRTASQPDDGLEWWERKAQTERPEKSAVVGKRTTQKEPIAQPPTLNPEPPPSYQSNRQSAFDASPPIVKKASNKQFASGNEEALRQLSARRERLEKEGQRVRSALERKDYNSIFDDDGVVTPMPERSRPRDIPPAPKHNSRPRREYTPEPEMPPPPEANEDDPPLLAMIKNCRAAIYSAPKGRRAAAMD